MVKTGTHTTGGTGLIPGWGAKILHTVQHGPKEKKDPSCCSFMAIPTPPLPTPENYEEMLYNSIIVISRK